MAAVRLAVIGAGAIGRRHAGLVLEEPEAALAAVVDPTDAGRRFAETVGAPWHPELDALLAASRPDGVIIATPNALHATHGLAAIAAGLPALIEKPLADDLPAAERLVAAAEAAGVPLLTGHHRRHNPLIRAARAAIEAGHIGRVVAAHATCWFHKPDAYFEVPWRRQAGAGPILINATHDIDLLRCLCGEIISVQALVSHAVRGLPVEDSAVLLLHFASGALGTVTVSDSIAAPWSWELTSGENPAYPRTGETCMVIGGTRGSLAVPQLDLWSHDGVPDWMAPIGSAPVPAGDADPLALQIRNLVDVIRGDASPVVSGRDGLATLRVVEAAKRSAAAGKVVMP